MNQSTQKHPLKRYILLGVIIFLALAAAALAVFAVLRLTGYSELPLIASDPVSEQPEPTADLQQVAPNGYTGAFFDDTYFLRYEQEGTDAYQGVDVSSYQGEIDWQQVAQAGADFAIIRAGYRGYTEGKIGTDTRFFENMDGALAAGLKVGAYFFSQAISPAEALEEADYICDLLEGYTVSYPIFFDWEDIEQTARTDGMTSTILTQCATAFCKRVNDRGFEAGIYFNQRFGYQELDLKTLEYWSFWLAEYNVPPTFQYDFDIWQYSCEGTVPGIETPVDLNLYFEKRNENGYSDFVASATVP